MRALHNCSAGKITQVRVVAAAMVLGLALGVSGTAIAQDDYVSGTSSVWLSGDEGFEGYWKYCLTITWDVRDFSDPARALSHVSILLGLDNCPRACATGYFAFDDTVGTSTGEDGCTVYYYSEFVCKGDPTIPVRVPAMKFEPYGTLCEPGTFGTTYVCFYSLAPPKLTYSFPSAVWIKFGLSVTSGSIEGFLPSCIDPTNAVEPSTWGRIKALID